MWYRFEALGQSNQVHHLQLLQKVTLMKNCNFLWRHIKIKKCKSCIINPIPRLKRLIFLCFCDELCKTLEKDWQKITISTRMKKFHFQVKYAVFIKNENKFLKNSDFWYTWSYDHIQQMFQISERSDQYSKRYDILDSYPFWNSIMLYPFYVLNNVIPIGWYFKMSYLLEYWSDRSEFWNIYWIWSLDNV